MNYVETVADLFLKRSGAAILSAADYVLIAEWEKEEIPLDTVLTSIREGLNDFKENVNDSEIDSISYFQEIIRENFAKRLQEQISEK